MSVQPQPHTRPQPRPNYNELLIHGTFYFPAKTHYSSNPIATVTCDMCHQTQLRACIGYRDWDVCLTCANTLTELINSGLYQGDAGGQARLQSQPQPRPQPQGALTYMAQDQFGGSRQLPTGGRLTRMAQSQFLTNMEQKIFKAPPFPGGVGSRHGWNREARKIDSDKMIPDHEPTGGNY